jgi:two-component system response regulator
MNSQDKPVNIESAVAFIRHELRTPINAIVGYGEMVQEDLEEDESPFLPQLNYLLSETKDLLKTINILVKLSDDNSYEVKNLKKLFVSITHSTNPSIEKIILYSNNLFSNIDEINIKEDIEKIRLSAIRLQGLVNNIDSIFDNFLESLNTNQESSEFQANSSKEKSPGDQNNALEITNNDPNKLAGRILVIDDNASNLDLLFRHLTRKGHSVTTSLSAKEALTLLESENYDFSSR